MIRFNAALFSLVAVVSAQQKIDLDPSLLTRGDLVSIAREKIKQHKTASIKEAIICINELDRRGASNIDWEEFRINQALANCHFEIGELSLSFFYWGKLKGLDTSKYTGKRPSYVTPPDDILYNRIFVYEKLAFNKQNKSSPDSLNQYGEMVDALYKRNPGHSDMADLLFNKALFMYAGGNLASARQAIDKIKTEYPDFTYRNKLDTLDNLIGSK